MTGLEVVRAAYGLAVVVAGPRIAALVAGRPLGRGEALVVRALGARHVAQAAVTVAAPQLAKPAVLVDAAHAASLLGFALSPRHRRMALADLPAATAFTAAETARSR